MIPMVQMLLTDRLLQKVQMLLKVLMLLTVQ